MAAPAAWSEPALWRSFCCAGWRGPCAPALVAGHSIERVVVSDRLLDVQSDHAGLGCDLLGYPLRRSHRRHTTARRRVGVVEGPELLIANAFSLPPCGSIKDGSLPRQGNP